MDSKHLVELSFGLVILLDSICQFLLLAGCTHALRKQKAFQFGYSELDSQYTKSERLQFKLTFAKVLFSHAVRITASSASPATTSLLFLRVGLPSPLDFGGAGRLVNVTAGLLLALHFSCCTFNSSAHSWT